MTALATPVAGPPLRPARAFELDGLLLCRSWPTDPVRVAGPVRAPDVGSIAVRHCIAGSARARAGADDLRLTPECIAISDGTATCAPSLGGAEILSVTIPPGRLLNADRVTPARPQISLPISSGRGTLLAGALALLWESASDGRIVQPAAVAGGFVGLVDGLLGHGVGPIRLDPAGTMEQFLRERLADPGLGSDDLQQAFSYSRSSIYRAFERHGGVAAFIRAERLRRCYEVLSRPDRAPEPISQVAARVGFHDASHFSRAFRARYGVSPSQLATRGRRWVGADADRRAAG